MLLQFVINAAVLMLCIFLFYFIQLHLTAYGVHKTVARYNWLVVGFIFGGAGALLIAAALRIEQSVLIDLRGVAIMLAALFGGYPSALTAAVFISAYRLWQGGLSYVPIIGVTCIAVTALGCAWIRSRFSLKRAFFLSLIFNYLASVITFSLVVQDYVVLMKLWIYYGLISIPVGAFCYLLIQNLNRMRNLYERMMMNENKYRLLFHSTQDMVFLIEIENSRPSRYLDINETACKSLGYSRKELLHTSPFAVYDPAYLDKLPDVVKAYKEQGRYTFEWGYMSRDGRQLPVEISGKVFEMEGKPVLLSVARDITLRKEAEQKLREANQLLERQSVSDGLTGIANRRGFDAYYEKVCEEARETGLYLSVLLLDIDCFKLYNDTYGHLAGDQCLREVAGQLEKLAKRTDAYVARYGGEEFVVVLPGADAAEAVRRGQWLCRGIEAMGLPHASSTVGQVVTVSVGAASYKGEAVDPGELVDAADRGLYLAKRGGRNRVHLGELTRGREL